MLYSNISDQQQHKAALDLQNYHQKYLQILHVSDLAVHHHGHVNTVTNQQDAHIY